MQYRRKTDGRLDRSSLMMVRKFLRQIEDEKRNLRCKALRGELLKGKGDYGERAARYRNHEIACQIACQLILEALNLNKQLYRKSDNPPSDALSELLNETRSAANDR